MRILRYLKVQFFLFALLPGTVFSLGLGNLDLESALDEKFSARIQLVLTDAEELDDSLVFRLANSEAFKRAGVERPFILSLLRFELRRAEDAHYVHVYSKEPIQEPFLDFLMEVQWSKGRLLRQYTVLLDPLPHAPPPSKQLTTTGAPPAVVAVPIADDVVNIGAVLLTGADAAAAASTVAAQEDIEGVDSTATSVTTIADDVGQGDGDLEHKVVYAEDFERYVTDSSGTYGPTRGSDTLWSIAKAARPDDSISIQQMMLALLYANQDAFLHQNINGLKRGQILRIPSASELDSLSYAEALAAVNSQHASWEEIKQDIIGDTASERPVLSSDAGTVAADTEEAAVTAEAELRLVSPSEEKEVAGTAYTPNEKIAEKKAPVTGVAATDLVLAQESIEVLTQENADLRDQLQETEALIEDLKRLVELKEDKLAALQAQLMERQAALGTMEAGDVVTENDATNENITETVTMDEQAAMEVQVDTGSADLDMPVAGEWHELSVTTGTILEDGTILLEDGTILEEGSTPEAVSTPEDGASSATKAATIKDNIFTILIGIGGVILVSLLILFVISRLEKKSTDTDEDVALAEGVLDSEEMPLTREKEEGEESLFEAGALSDLSEDKAGLDQHAPTGDPEEKKESLQEVNTYLAFEQFDQAEECVRVAIEQEPDNLDYYIKLLEVFYTAGNKKSYEEAAETLSKRVDEDSEYWGMAVAMWSEMSPSRALFEGGAEEEEEGTGDSGSSGGIVDVTTDVEATEGGLGLDLSDTAVEDTLLGASDSQSVEEDNVLNMPSSGTGLELDIDEGAALTDGQHSESESGLALEDVTPDTGKGGDSDTRTVDFSLDEEEKVLDLTGEIDPKIVHDDDKGLDEGEQQSDNSNVLDLDLDLDKEADLKLEEEAQISAQATEDELEKTTSIPLPSLPQQGLEDEVETKLDLARAYIELGDKENARSILGEVTSEGDEQQKKRAEELLARVDSAN